MAAAATEALQRCWLKVPSMGLNSNVAEVMDVCTQKGTGLGKCYDCAVCASRMPLQISGCSVDAVIVQLCENHILSLCPSRATDDPTAAAISRETMPRMHSAVGVWLGLY